MHWVDRGPEPVGLGPTRSRYTPRWIAHYEVGTGSRPSDSHWRGFRDDLSRVFFSLCAYCEESCRGVVDHFRPKSRFPELVYEWSNWVLACDSCNLVKGDKWPPGGYVDPCARSRLGRPENFFDFDTSSGTIIPRPGLGPVRRKKAIRTISDLNLNAHHHVQWRLLLLRAIKESLADNPEEDPAHRGSLEFFIARSTPLSSSARALLAERGYSFAP